MAGASPHLAADFVSPPMGGWREMIEEAMDRMKTEAGDVPLLAVGGGAFLVPDRLAGMFRGGPRAARRGRQCGRRRDRPGQRRGRPGLREMTREAAIAAAEQRGGAPRRRGRCLGRTLKLVDIEDMPLAYLPGDALRVRVRMVGDIGSG